MASKIYIVEEGPNPSTDYFVRPALANSLQTIIQCSWRELPTAQALQDATVIFVRYVPANWRRLIESVQKVKIIYFMDDDLFDTRVTRGQSWRYRYKLAHLGAWQQTWLAKRHAEYWLSTPWLQEKYKHLTPKLIQPTPLAQHEKLCRVFYHGSASHADEIKWLQPIMQTVLKENAEIVFEIIGDAKTNHLYRNLPRVNVVYPMKWLAYQAFISEPGRDIGLAPMLGSTFNRSRSYTKFFDITRAGAAGIYTEHGPWDQILTNQINGLLIPRKETIWIDTILKLSSDVNLRRKIFNQAKKTIDILKIDQNPLLQTSET
jgi:hypothetical protein